MAWQNTRMGVARRNDRMRAMFERERREREWFKVVTALETFHVDIYGYISRPKLGMRPSGEWKALALVRRCNFGVVETIPFEQWSTRLRDIRWTYKNGKPRYTLRDLDHGTVREWGNCVQVVYED